MNKKIILCLLSWCYAWAAFAQDVDAVIIPPPQTSYMADFFSNPNLFRVIATNKTLRAIDVKIGGKLVLDGITLAATDVNGSDIFTLNPGANFFNGEDVFKQFMRGRISVDTSKRSLQDMLYSGQWPSGLYEWCIEIRHATTNVELLPNKCVRRFVTSYQVPILAAPTEGQVLNNPGTVLFRWTPLTPGYKDGIVYYEVRVFDIKAGQTPMQAFQANFPIIEKKVANLTSLVWPTEVPIENGRYIWTVRPLDAQDRPICFPAQFAEAVVFNVIKGNPSSNPLGQAAFSAVFPEQQGSVRLRSKKENNTIGVKLKRYSKDNDLSQIAFAALAPQSQNNVTNVDADDEFLRFQVDLSELGASSTEAGNSLRIYMIEKKAGYFTKAALLQAIRRDKLLYKSPLLNINAQNNNVELAKILPDSLAGREFAWIIRAEVAGRIYDSEVFTFEYQAAHLKRTNKLKPKFDCECKDSAAASPVVADRLGVSTWKVGDTLYLGGYGLRLTAWNNGEGKGIIDLPYAKVGIKVGLSNIRANKDKRIFEGNATVEEAGIATGIKNLATWQPTEQALITLNQHFSSMVNAVETGLTMPLSFQQHLNALQLRLPYDLVVTGMRFSPQQSELDLAAWIKSGENQYIKFEAKKIIMTANGISLKNLRLYLAEDVVFNNLSLKASTDENVGSYIQFDCNGLKTFHLQTTLTFDPKHVQTLSEEPLTTMVKLDATDWGDFLAKIKLASFRLTDVKGITFEAKDWILDKSAVRNAAELKLPNQATPDTTGNWQGLFTEGVTVNINKDLLPSADKDLTLQAKDITWDSLGLSAQMTSSKLALASPQGDWSIGIDSLDAQIAKSQLANMNFTGSLSLAYLFKDLKYKATLQRDSTQRISYAFAPETDITANLWKATFKLGSNSQLMLLPTETASWQLAANLDAEVAFNIGNSDVDTSYIAALKTALGFGDFSLEIPKISFKGLKINHPDLPKGQKISVQSVKTDKPFKLGGLDIDLLGIDFEEDTITVNEKVRKGRVMNLHLSKEVDFDCKIWSFQSETDTNRWSFGKLSFGIPIPKIECKTPETVAVTNQTTKTVTIGDKIQIGSFSMEVQKLATENSLGTGVIRIPYLATNVAVQFNNSLKINESGIAFQGSALANVSSAIFPNNALETTLNGSRKVNVNLLDFSQVDAHIANLSKTAILPLSFKKMLRSYGNKLPFDILITDLNFASAMPTMSLVMSVPVAGNVVNFEVPQIGLSQRGFNLGEMRMQLANNIDLGNGLRLLRGSDSYAQLTCDGFETFGLAGEYALSSTHFAALGKTSAPLATFKAKTKQFSDFIATAAIESFSIKAIKGSEITVTKAVFDRSATENTSNLTFPTVYKGNKEASWKGIYVEDFTLKMPSILPNQGDKTLIFNGKGLILDSTGITTRVTTSNIASVGSDVFGMTIKDLTVDIVQNSIDSALLTGNVRLPLFSEAIDFEGTYAKDSMGSVAYALTASKEANLNFWRANLKINKGSALRLVKTEKDTWERQADLDIEAKLDVNTRMLEEYVNADILRGIKTAVGVDLLDFELPTFKFKGLKVNHPKSSGGRTFSLDSYEATGPLKLAGQEIKLIDVNIIEDTATIKGKSYKKSVGLVFQFFKGTDFELSTWAVPSETDSNKWDFGKFDLKFAIPKFECAAIPTENIVATSNQNLTIGQAVNVGGFVMKIEQLASGGQKGVGRLRIPYFGTTLKINFDAGMQVNSEGKLFGGTLLSQVDESIIPTDALLNEVNGLRRVAIDKLNLNGLKNYVANVSEMGVRLPLSLKQSMGRFGNKLPFDLWLTHINFTGSESYMSLAMLLPYGNNNVARFSLPKLRLNAKGFNMSDVEMGLAQNIALADGLYLSGSEAADKTVGKFGCDGFKGLKLDGYYQLDANQFVQVGNSAAPKINFTGEANSLNDFIVDAAVEPLGIKALERSELTIKKAIFDHSTTKNQGLLSFPKNYKGKTDATWQGVYVQDFTLKLPSFLPNQDNQMLSFNGKALILDSTGVTALAQATNITSIGNGSLGMSIDTVSVDIVQNQLTEARLGGRIAIPFFGQNVRFAGTYNKDSVGNAAFSLATTQATNLNFWKANLKINAGSGLELVKNSANKWQYRASIDLEAKLDVNTKMLEEYVSADILRGLKTALGVDLLDFELPTFKFKGFKINELKGKNGRKYSLDSYEATGPLKIAGQELKLTDIDIIEDTVTVKGKSYKKSVGLVFQFFKGTDFELSTWAVPSETDSNKWVFGKWDLKFAIPKFECAPVAPLTVDNAGNQPLETAKTVQIGSFSMTIDQSPNGTQLGIGRIRIPYFGSTLKVNFDEKLRINAQNQVYGGVVWSQVNPAILPATALLSEATTGIRKVNIAGLNINSLEQIVADNSNIGISLPLSFKKSMGKLGRDLPFDVLVTHINFTGSAPQMSLAMLVPAPNGEMARFIVPKLNLSKKGFDLSNIQLQLAQDMPIGNGFFLSGSDTAAQTFASLNCGGFSNFQLNGYYELNRDLFSAVNNTTAPKARFSAKAEGLDKFIATATIEPFRINALNGSELTVTNAILDRSDVENSAALKFPTFYKGKKDATWQGVFVKDFTLKVPSFLPNQADKQLILSGKDMVFDSTGATAFVQATNVLATSTPTEGGWGLSVDTLNMTLVANKIDSASLAGAIELPFFSQNIPYRGVFQNTKGTPYYSLSTTADAAINFWKASVGINKGSNIEIFKNANNKWERRAKLYIETQLNVNTQALQEYVDADVLNALKDVLGVNVLDFELPKIKLNGFKINYPDLPAGKMFALDSFTSTGNIRLAGQDIKLVGIELVQDSVTVKGTKHSKGVGLVFKLFKGIDFDFSIWSVPSSTDSTKWSFGKYDLNFGIPKFECVVPTPIVVNNTTPRIPKVGEMVNLAGFSMKIDQLANPNQFGIGRIRIPYLGTTVKVSFDNKLAINTEGKVSVGFAFSQINTSLFPSNAITSLTNGRAVALAQMNLNALDQIIADNTPTGIPLPLSLRKSMGSFGNKLPFDVLVTNINFTSTTPNMSLAMLVPDRSGKMVRFSAPNLGLSPKGFSLSNLRFQLESDYELAQGLFLSGSSTQAKTSAQFNCEGFESLNLEGYYQFNTQQFRAISGTNAPRATFKTSDVSLNNFMAQVTVDPMQIVSISNSELRITKAILDRSNTKNDSTMRFPQRYKGKTDRTWNGIYIQDATLRLPSFLPNDNRNLSLSSKNLIVDSTGVSGMLEAANVLSVQTNDALGWGLSVDTLRLTVLQNQLDSAALRGSLSVPLFAEPIRYAGNYKQDSTGTIYNLATTNDATLRFFGANMTLVKGAEVAFEKMGTQWVRSAKMDVTAGFQVNRDSLTKYGGSVANLDTLRRNMGLSNLNFEFPTITLKGLKVNHKSLPMGKTYGIDTISISGNLKIAGQEVAIRAIDLIESNRSVIVNGRTHNKSLQLVFQLNKIIDVELAIVMVPDARDNKKWTFGSFNMKAAIPKFECVTVAPTPAPTGTGNAVKLNQEVNIGDFKMKVTKLATGTAPNQLGEGEIRIPYMGTTMKVRFDNNLSVAADGKVLRGVVRTDLNASFLPVNSFRTDATIGNTIDATRINISNLSALPMADVAISMPMSLKQRMGRFGEQLPFDLLVTNVNLAPTKQSMSLAMLVPNVMGTTVRFATNDLQLNGKGFGLSSVQLALADNDIALGGGVFINGAQSNLRTRAVFNCDGLESFSLAGRYEFPNTAFVRPMTGAGNARLEFSGTSTSLTNFIVEANATPLQLSFLTGSELRLSRLSYDYSATTNAPFVKFPPQYGATVPNTWRGFYAEEASLAIPSLFPNQSGRLRFAGKNILLDSLGLSGTFQVQDIFSTNIDNLWQFRIDTFGVRILRNKLDNIQLAGQIGFPFLGVSTQFDGNGIQTITNLGKDTTYAYTISPKGNLNLNAWRMNFALLNTSKITLSRTQKAGQATNSITAQLDAEVNLDLNTNFIKENTDPALLDILRSKLGVDVLDFAFPKLRLTNLQFDPKAKQKITIGKIEALGDVVLAGIKVDVVSTVVETGEITTKNGKKQGTAFVMTLRKTGVNFKFRLWAVPDSKDTTKWTFGKLDLLLDLPKFSCTNSTVAFADKRPAGSLSVGRTVKVAGDFNMEVTQLASGATPGRGKITVPHFGTTYDVTFGTNVKINSKNEVIEGNIITLANQEMFPASSFVRDANGLLDLDLKKLEITEGLMTKLQSLNSVTKFPISMSSALSKMNEMLELPSLDIPLDITITGISFTPTGAMLTGFTTVKVGDKYMRLGVAGLTIHKNGVTFDKLKLFLVDNL